MEKDSKSERSQAFWATVGGLLAICSFLGISRCDDIMDRFDIKIGSNKIQNKEKQPDIQDIKHLKEVSILNSIYIELVNYQQSNEDRDSLINKLMYKDDDENPQNWGRLSKKGRLYFDNCSGKVYELEGCCLPKLEINNLPNHFKLHSNTSINGHYEVYFEDIVLNDDSLERHEILNGICWKGSAELTISAIRKLRYKSPEFIPVDNEKWEPVNLVIQLKIKKDNSDKIIPLIREKTSQNRYDPNSFNNGEHPFLVENRKEHKFFNPDKFMLFYGGSPLGYVAKIEKSIMRTSRKEEPIILISKEKNHKN